MMAVFSLIELGEYMTENEAIEVFKERLTLIKEHYAEEVKDYEEALEIGIQALEKQIPKKPMIKHINTSEDATEIEYTCPVCGTNFVELTPCREWCPYCGNKIYWSDEE